MNSTRFIDESKVCALCDEALSVADIDLMSNWLLELTRYEANFFTMFCRKCFDKTYPGYLNSKMTLILPVSNAAVAALKLTSVTAAVTLLGAATFVKVTKL